MDANLEACHPRDSFAQKLFQFLAQSFIGDPVKLSSSRKWGFSKKKSGSPMKLPYEKLKKFFEAASSGMTRGEGLA